MEIRGVKSESSVVGAGATALEERWSAPAWESRRCGGPRSAWAGKSRCWALLCLRT